MALSALEWLAVALVRIEKIFLLLSAGVDISSPDQPVAFKNIFNTWHILSMLGGCTVSLVRSTEIDNVIKQIDSEYHGATFYVCQPANGARAIDLGNLN